LLPNWPNPAVREKKKKDAAHPSNKTRFQMRRIGEKTEAGGRERARETSAGKGKSQLPGQLEERFSTTVKRSVRARNHDPHKRTRTVRNR